MSTRKIFGIEVPTEMPPKRIAELKANMNGVQVKGRIARKTEPGPIETRFGSALFCTAVLEDETGSIKLNLYRDQTAVKVGDMVRIQNGFTNAYGELNIGKRGKVEILG